MQLSRVFGVFGVICIICAFVLSCDVSDSHTESLSGNGGLIGPFTVEEKNSNYEVTVRNNVANGRWSYVEVAVLDANKKHLFSFGDEMWYETGYDDEGSWEDAKRDYTMDIAFKEAGQYYFNIGAEADYGEGEEISITLVKERGSNTLFRTLGILSLILALFYLFRSSDKTSTKSDAASEDGSKFNKVKRSGILISVLVIVFILALFYSLRGWGYMGYHGYHRGPSFFYWGGPRIYHDPSVRDGSVSGSGHRGGGLSSGK